MDVFMRRFIRQIREWTRRKKLTVCFISRFFGGTSQKRIVCGDSPGTQILFLIATAIEFPSINKEELLDILRDAIKDDALVISTLVDGKLAAVLEVPVRPNGLAIWIWCIHFYEIIREKDGHQSYRGSGTLHRLDPWVF